MCRGDEEHEIVVVGSCQEESEQDVSLEMMGSELRESKVEKWKLRAKGGNVTCPPIQDTISSSVDDLVKDSHFSLPNS